MEIHDKGRSEVSVQDFIEITGKNAEGFRCTLDLKEVFPGLFFKSTKIPNLLDQAWRKVLEDLFMESKGTYTYNNGTAIYIFFENLPAPLGKLKLENATRKIREMIETDEDAVQDLPLPDEEPVPKKDSAIRSKLPARGIRENLGENPSRENVELWVSRVAQNIRHASQSHPMVPELIELSQQLGVHFFPVWNAPREMITGNVCKVCNRPEKLAKGELLRQDLAMLSAGIMETVCLIAAKRSATITIPLRLSTIQNEEIKHFYFTVLRKLGPRVRQNLIFEIKGLSVEKLTPENKKNLEELQSLSQAIIVNTGILSKPDYKENSGLNVYAYGFDLAGFKLSETEIIDLTNKYAFHYIPRGIKIYAKGVVSRNILIAAKEIGFSYLSGPAIFPMTKSGIKTQPLPFQKLKEVQS